jgi:5-methyltetrahydrofolate--homocysteine methyltransferase
VKSVQFFPFLGAQMNYVKQAASFEKLAFAREQRREPSKAERLLWNALRNGKLGFKFRRQHPIDLFILDFYCDAAKLAVEVDGPLHEGREEYDEWRDRRLQDMGVRTVRFSTEAVEWDVVLVTDEILRHLTA